MGRRKRKCLKCYGTDDFEVNAYYSWVSPRSMLAVPGDTAALQQKFVSLALSWAWAGPYHPPKGCHESVRCFSIVKQSRKTLQTYFCSKSWEKWVWETETIEFVQSGKDTGWPYCSLPIPVGSVEEYMRIAGGAGWVLAGSLTQEAMYDFLHFIFFFFFS